MKLVPTVPSLVELARERLGPLPERRGGEIWPIPPALTGRTVHQP